MVRLHFIRFNAIIIFSCLLSINLYTQIHRDTASYFVETGGAFSSESNHPFWLVSNNFNSVPVNSPSIWARGSISGKMNIEKLHFMYGADILDRLSHKNELIVQQAYIGLKLHFIRLKGGFWEESFGNQDVSLSSGGLIWSGNARPIPEINLSVPEYTPVPFTGEFAEFKGGISHGWVPDNPFYSKAWLHHKFINLKFGGNYRMHLGYGLHHYAIWGGVSSSAIYGNFPNDLRAFVKVFLGQGGDENAPDVESVNAIGNHIGSHNFSIDIKWNKYSSNFYWQTIFEDGSGLRLKNIRDGLWGVQIVFNESKSLRKIVAEVINTTHQSGPSGDHLIDSVYVVGTGNDNYFNNGIYQSGWTNRGMTIGTPLITSPNLLAGSPAPYVKNNKLTAFHLGAEGSLGQMDFKVLYTFSKNFGTNSFPFQYTKNQHNILLKSTFKDLLPWNINTTLICAMDAGDLFENTIGFIVSLRKEGLIFK